MADSSGHDRHQQVRVVLPSGVNRMGALVDVVREVVSERWMLERRKGFRGSLDRRDRLAGSYGAVSRALSFRDQRAALEGGGRRALRAPLRDRLTARLEGLQGVDVVTTARLLLTEFVRFAAEHPELHRFMLQEGTGPSERLEWLVTKHVATMGALLRGMLHGIESAGGPSLGPPSHVFYVLIGAVSTPYALAPQVLLTTGKDPFSEEYIETHTELILRLFIPERLEAFA